MMMTYHFSDSVKRPNASKVWTGYKIFFTMFVSPYEILEFFARAETARDEQDTESLGVADGLPIRSDVDVLPDGKRVDRLSELANDKLSIRLYSILSLVRYYFVLFLLRIHAKPTKVALKPKHPPKFFKFRSASGRVLQVPCESRPSRSDWRFTGCPIDCHGDCEFCAKH